MEKLRLSIAMCTCDGASYVDEQLDSIAAQTRLPDELVVCDDRSSDGTIASLERFAARAPFAVRIHRNHVRLGSTKNFERAISLCQGEVIFLADQDDQWLATKLERMESVFAASPNVGAVVSDAELVDEGLRPLNHRLWQKMRFGGGDRRRAAKGRLFEVLLRRNVTTGATMAFRSSFRDLTLPIPPDWVHDGWIALLIAAVSEVAFVDEPLVRYRQHPQQQIGGKQGPSVTWNDLGEASSEILGYRHAFSARGWENCFSALRRFTLAYERLATSGQLPADDLGLAGLREKNAHFLVRVDLPDQRVRRLPLIAGELVRGRYRRYSRGVASVVNDLARVGKGRLQRRETPHDRSESE